MARPKTLDGASRKSMYFDIHQMAKITRWQKALRLTTMSAAVRAIIDRAPERPDNP